MVSTIRYTANASSDHHPNQVPGILIIMNPKQPNLPTCSVTSTYLLFHFIKSIFALHRKQNIGYHDDCNNCSDVSYFLRWIGKNVSDLTLEDAESFLTAKRLEGRMTLFQL